MEPITERVGRRGFKVIGFKPVKVRVDYCPVHWDPDPVWVCDAADIHAKWVDAMLQLMSAVAEIRFTDHDLVGTGIEADPVQVVAPLIYDAATFSLNSEGVLSGIDVDLAPAFVAHVQEHGISTHTRVARTVRA